MPENNNSINKDLVYLHALCSVVDLPLPGTVDEKEKAVAEKKLEEAYKVLGLPESETSNGLKSIFEVVLGSGNENCTIPAIPLTLEGNKLYPGNFSEDKQALLNELKEKAANLEFENHHIYAENLFYLLLTYTSTLPEPTGNYPGVSLFDYTKLLAATAVCLLESDNDEKPFLLLRADVSGIQNYIFSIASKNAAKNLKGRSFYVRLLSDTVLYKTLWDLELYNSNIVYSSGGNFMLLVPNNEAVRGEISNIANSISDSFFEEYQTSISLVLGHIPLAKDELTSIDLKGSITRLFEIIDKSKKQKYAGEISRDFEGFFNPKKVKDAGGSIRRDAITGEEFNWEETAWYEEKGRWKRGQLGTLMNEDSIDLYKEISMKQIELGKLLKDASYWIIAKYPIATLENEELNPAGLGVYHYLIRDEDIARYRNALKGHHVTILQFNEPDYSNNAIDFGSNKIYGFTFYGGNDVPVFEHEFKDEDDPDREFPYKKGDPKTFNHLAYRLQYDENKAMLVKAGRFSRIGVLRLDVDGLGWMFNEGLKEENYNLLTYATISRNLDLFFMGVLNTIWREGSWIAPGNTTERFRDSIQIIYSGGDDLFIVGRWDACLYFAKSITKNFRKWTCQDEPGKAESPKLSISGGIAILTNKFPIIKGASFAATAEKYAKSYTVKHDAESELPIPPGSYQKNAFTLWKPLHWEWEFEKVELLKNNVLKFMEEQKFHSVFRRLMTFYELKSEFDGQKEDGRMNVNPKWVWLLVYNISRTMEQYHRDRNFCEFLNEVKNDIFSNTYQGRKSLYGEHQYFDLLQIAIRWAELEHRTFFK